MTEESKKLSEQDVEKCRKPWELDDYWHLKKEFLLTYKDDYESDRLQALAQVFINIEVMGNTYDPTIMALIRRLTENWDSLKAFRENKRMLAAEKKKTMIKSQQVENERKRLKTDYKNSYEQDDNGNGNGRNSYNRNNNYNHNYNDNRNDRNDNQSGNKAFTFGSQSVYTNQEIPAYNSNYKNRRF